MNENKWISVDGEEPRYYDVVLVWGKCDSPGIPERNEMYMAWRASDGEKDYYTIYPTNIILTDVYFWMNLPDNPK